MIDVLVMKIGLICIGIETRYVHTVTRDIVSGSGESAPVVAGYVKQCNDKNLPVIDFGKNIFPAAVSGNAGNEKDWVEYVVLHANGYECAVVVGEVVDVYRISEGDIAAIPLFALKRMSGNFFKGVFRINDGLALMLDVPEYCKEMYGCGEAKK
jgi:chemotaxis signal transduction protein